jgi:DNA-directed RNA polymerase specialized sigma24 family protein
MFVTDKEETKIIELVNSMEYSEREKGVSLFINSYEGKVRAWLIKRNQGHFAEDIWIEAAHTMIRAIQAGLYTKIPGVSMYTYFHTIVRGVASRYFKENPSIFKEVNEQENDLKVNDTPEDYLFLKELLNALDHCLLKMKIDDRNLLRDIILNGKKLIDLLEVYNLKNYNNAKQKYFKIKKELLNCLKSKGI